MLDGTGGNRGSGTGNTGIGHLSGNYLNSNNNSGNKQKSYDLKIDLSKVALI
jgi:hypothetical protein